MSVIDLTDMEGGINRIPNIKEILLDLHHGASLRVFKSASINTSKGYQPSKFPVMEHGDVIRRWGYL